MRRLEVYQSLWAMQPHGPDGAKLPLAEAFTMVAEAGYDGMAIDLGAADMAAMQATLPLFRETGLGCLVIAFPKSVADLRPALRMAKDFGAVSVTVIGQAPALTLAEMIPIIRAWIAMGRDEGVVLEFETHRNCITNDLYTVLELIEAIPEMRLAADLSHVLVDREFRYPVSDYDRALVSRVLARADSFQGRIGTREQVQIPIGFPQHRKWVELFEGWWEEGFRSWRDRNARGTCRFLCELGPPDYAITGADGRELSNRWEEALAIRARVRAIWDRLEAEQGA